jgi:hypothetical protein
MKQYKPIIVRAVCAGVFLLFSLAMQAQTFKASHLKKAYEKLHLNKQTECRSDLTIRTTADGTIEHIGIPLFSDEIRRLLPSPIYDYLEFALLDHKYHINDNTLQQQKIRFFNGSWADLEQMRPSDNCTIDNRDDKWYIVKWTRDSQNPLMVVVPIEYELLANSTRKEMEQNFSRQLKQFQPKHDQTNGSVSALDASAPKEVLSNILLTSHDSPQVTLNIELLYAGFRKESVSVSLPQWMGYCRSAGCTPYYIYEGTQGDQASAMLLMYNRSEGYAHLLHLHAAISQLKAQEQTYQGKVYMFIPTNNIEDLFAKLTGPSTPKTYE